MKENIKTEPYLRNEELQAVLGGCYFCSGDQNAIQYTEREMTKHNKQLGRETDAATKAGLQGLINYHGLLKTQAAERIEARQALPGHNTNGLSSFQSPLGDFPTMKKLKR